MLHNFMIAANGAGQFYDRIGHPIAAESRNATVGPPLRSKKVPMTKASLDLDSVLIFYGGPSTKQDKIKSFLAANADKVAVDWTSDVSKLHLLRSTKPGVSVRALLRAADIETRQEEETRTRAAANTARKQQQQQQQQQRLRRL